MPSRPAGRASQRAPSTRRLQPHGGGLILKTPLHPGGVALLGLTGIAPARHAERCPCRRSRRPPKPGDIVGVVWRDFKPGGGKPGVVEQGELGMPGVTVELQRLGREGRAVGEDRAADGAFDFTNVAAGTYHAGIGAQTFAKPFGGYSWLGPKPDHARRC